jgi:hypothetical protein
LFFINILPEGTRHMHVDMNQLAGCQCEQN